MHLYLMNQSSGGDAISHSVARESRNHVPDCEDPSCLAREYLE